MAGDDITEERNYVEGEGGLCTQDAFTPYLQYLALVELFFPILDLHRPQEVSISHDFLAPETQEIHAHMKKKFVKTVTKIVDIFSTI
jgi:hypothetical protein